MSHPPTQPPTHTHKPKIPHFILNLFMSTQLQPEAVLSFPYPIHVPSRRAIQCLLDITNL
jgi:hypothetical protein